MEENKKKINYTVFDTSSGNVEEVTENVLGWLDEMRKLYPKKEK